MMCVYQSENVTHYSIQHTITYIEKIAELISKVRPFQGKGDRI
jgi:hypothetical protein